MTEGKGAEAGTVTTGDDGEGQAAADRSGQGVVTAFGQSVKTLRVRAGLEREEFRRRLGYSASTVPSYEQGRRIPSPRTIDQPVRADTQYPGAAAPQDGDPYCLEEGPPASEGGEGPKFRLCHGEEGPRIH